VNKLRIIRKVFTVYYLQFAVHK